MSKKDKTMITLSVLYPLFLLFVIALESPFSFYLFIALGIILCIYWATRFFRGDISFSSKEGKKTNTVKGDDLNYFSVADELLKWNELRDKGAITDDEYQQEKSRLLKRDA